MDMALFRNEVPPDDPLFAHGYVGTPAGLEPGPSNPYEWGTIGAGGVWSTVGDIYRWLVAVMAHRLLPEAQRRVLLSPPPPPAQEAFGWHVETAPDGRQRISKGGGSDDFASQLLYYPAERVAIVWTSNNLRQRWRSTLNLALPGIIFGGSPVSLPRVVAAGPQLLASRSGRYASGRGTVEIRAGSGYLYATANDLNIPSDVMFFPQDSDHFTGFNPVTRAVTHLDVAGADTRSLAFALPGGRRIVAHRVDDK
jgi:hypothetical protein